jgi:hypothetical protein
MKKVRTDCEGGKIKESWRVWEFWKLKNYPGSLKKIVYKKTGAPVIEKKVIPAQHWL